MKIPLHSDLNNDKEIFLNIGRIALFILLFFVLDNLVSIILLRGIEKNYGIGGNSEILLVGHSHLMLSIDKDMLENKTAARVAKYTREGVNISDRKIMLQHYFASCSSKPSIVVLGIDPWLFSSEGLSRNSYQLFLPFMGQEDIRNYIKKSISPKSAYLRAEIIKSSRYSALLLNTSIRGYIKNWSNLKIGVVDSTRIRKEISENKFRKIDFNNFLINDFVDALDFLDSTKAEIILLNTPIWRPEVDAQPSEYKKTMQMIDSLKKLHCPSARIIDLVPEFSKKTKYFFDPIHLNPEGQRVITEYFARVLDSLKTEVKVPATASFIKQ